MSILKRTIIGVMLAVGLIIQVSPVYAIYSSTISKKASSIRQHVLSARQQSGSGTLLNLMQKMEEKNKGLPTPVMVTIAFGEIMGYSFWDVIWPPMSFLDPIYMIFNAVPSTGETISTCLRNDIWMLEDLRDIVAQEMLKAYMVGDKTDGDLLRSDYKYLRDHIQILKKYGNHPLEPLPFKVQITENGKTTEKTMTVGEYLFGHVTSLTPYSFQFPVEKIQGTDQESCEMTCKNNCQKIYDCRNKNGGICEDEDQCKSDCKDRCGTVGGPCESECKDACENSCEAQEDCKDQCESGCSESSTIEWGGCPEGEFLPAFNEVWESMKNLGTIGTWQAADWGSIWEMARARARRRADEWIKANQITLTIGGEEGGNPQSLIKGGGFARFMGSLNTQLQILSNMTGIPIPIFSWDIYKSSSTADEMGGSCGCMYYDAEAGTYSPCSTEQSMDSQECATNKDAAEAKGIVCDSYKQPGEPKNALQIIDEQKEVEAQHVKDVKRIKTTFTYNMELSDVNDEMIKAIDQKLSNINSKIEFSYKSEGSSGAKPLPDLYEQVATFVKKHGSGKFAK